LGIAIASPTFAQTAEKKVEKKKAVAKKKAEPKQEWGRFSAGSKKDLKKLEQEKAAKKAPQ
jgi:hypothetical protein